MKLRFALVVALAAWAPHAWAADGDKDTAASFVSRDYSVEAYKLCDAKVNTDSACGEFDTVAGQRTLGTFYFFAIDSDTGCSGAAAVAIKGADTSGGATHTIATITKGGTTAYQTPGPVPRYLSAALSTMTDCSNLTVRVLSYSRRTHQ